eukprot:TRINITY_DN2441_c0_g1_i3.p1 TRINITY_DN2441_c0_g1~~TRINITY_DN2441_c0_g1_i3.p1  ORF type:complete len:366 (-),score=63.40 TRINITY_DN2441_c0_g1_i3:776-1873(-)
MVVLPSERACDVSDSTMKVSSMCPSKAGDTASTCASNRTEVAGEERCEVGSWSMIQNIQVVDAIASKTDTCDQNSERRSPASLPSCHTTHRQLVRDSLWDATFSKLSLSRNVPFWFLCLFVALSVGLLSKLTWIPAREALPVAIMREHSVRSLNQQNLSDVPSWRSVQNKLQLKKMSIELDTQVFTASRESTVDIMREVCTLPAKFCATILAMASGEDVMFHKKQSIPLDDNKGSFLGVWMWVKSIGGGKNQVAYKSAQLLYELRDVVTYREQVVEEPVRECEESTWKFTFNSEVGRICRTVGTRRTVNQVPVFKQAILDSAEMEMVDVMMERMLSEKVLLDAGAGPVQRLGEAGAASSSFRPDE